jgi:hypothetical protein
MTIARIAVCDDNPLLAREWEREIQAAVGEGVVVSRIGDAGVEFRKLLARIPRDDKGAGPSEDSDFDRACVLVVDYDLLEIDADKARHTGEGFARMALLYSDCDFVIVMNQYADSAAFDLEMLGHLDSFADLNIHSSLAGSPALWGAARNSETFAPWTWPNIGGAIAGRRKLIERASQNIDVPLLEFLDFPAKQVAVLSDEAVGFLSAKAATAEELAEMSLRSFLEQSTEHKELARAITANPDRAAGAVVARLAKWYSRAVLGPQNVLVDVPHLLQRMPFLLSPDFGDPKDIDTWNRAIIEGANALVAYIAPAAFSGCSAWLGKDAYWWPDILELKEVQQARSEFEIGKYADIVFAEDASVFIPFDDAKPFRAGFHNQFDVRYLKFFPEITYGPSRRLASV